MKEDEVRVVVVVVTGGDGGGRSGEGQTTRPEMTTFTRHCRCRMSSSAEVFHYGAF